jgi:hypothetical protein
MTVLLFTEIMTVKRDPETLDQYEEPEWTLYGGFPDKGAAREQARELTTPHGERTNRFALLELPDENGLPKGSEILKGTPGEVKAASLRKV